ncbi:MAG: ABC transporter ATP-binding protein [Myxococcales bacterium]|jgi:ABC-type multidrug transport system ATPase subunit|nr:ABC transporter ATP-binding protein [Myxococcales bacterium]
MRLSVQAVHKQLGTRPILRGVSFTMAADEVVVILGENGSGKSTLLQLVAGILEPDAGQIRMDGDSLTGGAVAARRKLGYVPDSASPLPDLLVAELCALVCSLKQAPPPHRTLYEQLGVAPYLQQRLGTLSFGQRKRACLLAALIGNPSLLLLDEPSNGLDPEGVQLITSLIAERRRQGLATLLSSNDPPFANALHGNHYRIQDGLLTAQSHVGG